MQNPDRPSNIEYGGFIRPLAVVCCEKQTKWSKKGAEPIPIHAKSK
jgi:hypothetical protein